MLSKEDFIMSMQLLETAYQFKLDKERLKLIYEYVKRLDHNDYQDAIHAIIKSDCNKSAVAGGNIVGLIKKRIRANMEVKRKIPVYKAPKKIEDTEMPIKTKCWHCKQYFILGGKNESWLYCSKCSAKSK